MKDAIFTCNDVSVRVSSEEERILTYLENMFGDYYKLSENVQNVDSNLFFHTRKPDSYLYLDREKGDSTNNYITGDKDGLHIYLPEFNDKKLSYVKRIFTTSWVKTFQKKGYTILHGACAFKNNNGVVITGAPGSGKTTLLLKLLNRGYGYLANDRLALKMQDGKIIVCGIPFSMGIREEDIKKDVDGYDSYYLKEERKKFLENKEVPRYFSVDMKSSVPLSTIVFCAHDLNKTGVEVNAVENANERILSNVMIDDCIPEQKYYLHSIFGRYNNRLCDLSSVKTIELLQGLHSEKSTVDTVDKSLKSQKEGVNYMAEPTDITFKVGEVRVNCRAAAVIVHDGQILFQKREQDSVWALPGGKIAILEKGKDTIKREMSQEIGEDVEVSKSYGVIENFFEFNGEHFHEFLMCHSASLPADSKFYEKKFFPGIEEEKHLQFAWFDAKELDEYSIAPPQMKPFLKKVIASKQKKTFSEQNIETGEKTMIKSTTRGFNHDR